MKAEEEYLGRGRGPVGGTKEDNDQSTLYTCMKIS
jgi:hypothetical protein